MDKTPPTNQFGSLQDIVSHPTMEAINNLGFSSMTEIQALAIPPLLEGKDLRGTAKTGSGKTLAFLIPAVELLNRLDFQQTEGTGVLVLSPTRELAMQIHAVVRDFLEVYNNNRRGGCNWLTCGLMTGGTDVKLEKKILKKGTCILIATPGRLLDHLHNTECFKLQSLKCLVLDEADKMLDKHFEEAMKSILDTLPKTRQTMLFSATKTPKTNELVAVALKEDFVDVDASSKKGSVTVDTLKQTYVVCPTEKKFLFLYNVIKSFEKQKKMMVFFSSCDAVKFYYELLTYVQVDVLCIHGKQEQTQRTKSFEDFTSASSATLLCTDVAARGWDIPEVDYVLQFDPPHDPSEYIHRVGRTARGARSGEALLMLRAEEVPFVRCLEKRRARLTEQVLNADKLPDEQEKVEGIVEGIPFLRWWAKKAWKSTIHSYTLHKRKDIFNIYNLDIKKLGKSFGFSHPPKVDLAIEYKKSGEKKLLKRIKEGYYADAYERSDKEAGLEVDKASDDDDEEEEDVASIEAEEETNGVENSDDDCSSTHGQTNGINKKKKKSKKQTVNDESNVTVETEDNNTGKKKKKKSKKHSVDENVVEDIDQEKKKKSKTRKIEENGDVEIGEDDIEKRESVTEEIVPKDKKKKRKHGNSDGGSVVNDEVEQTIENGKKRSKKKKTIESNDDSIVVDTDLNCSQDSIKKQKKKKNRDVEAS